MNKQVLNDVFTAAQYTFNYTKADLMAKNREGNRPFARHLIQWYLIKKLKYTYHQAAIVTGRSSHLTARHGCRVVQEVLFTKDTEHLEYYNNFIRAIKALRRANAITINGQMDINKEGQITLYTEDGIAVWKEDVLTFICEDNVTKIEVPRATSIGDFMSIVINLK